jgi:hypothetical protein
MTILLFLTKRISNQCCVRSNIKYEGLSVETRSVYFINLHKMCDENIKIRYIYINKYI